MDIKFNKVKELFDKNSESNKKEEVKTEDINFMNVYDTDDAGHIK